MRGSCGEEDGSEGELVPPILDRNADLGTGAGVFFRVLIEEDVYPGVDHGCLQGGDAHPPARELRKTSLLPQLQHALVTLLVREIKPYLPIITVVDGF